MMVVLLVVHAGLSAQDWQARLVTTDSGSSCELLQQGEQPDNVGFHGAGFIPEGQLG